MLLVQTWVSLHQQPRRMEEGEKLLGGRDVEKEGERGGKLLTGEVSEMCSYIDASVSTFLLKSIELLSKPVSAPCKRTVPGLANGAATDTHRETELSGGRKWETMC